MIERDPPVEGDLKGRESLFRSNQIRSYRGQAKDQGTHPSEHSTFETLPDDATHAMEHAPRQRTFLVKEFIKASTVSVTPPFF